MYGEFWRQFCSNYTDNCKQWVHSPQNPVIPHIPGGLKDRWTANPDFLEFGGQTLLYYRGNGYAPPSMERRHDRILVARAEGSTADGKYLFHDYHTISPAVDVGSPGEFDCYDALDPTAVEFGGRVYLYYSAIGCGPDSLGLAVSEDGVRFEKKGKVLTGRGPSAVVTGDTIRLYYQLLVEGRYRVTYALSKDGVHFEPSGEWVLESEDGAWDSYSITTPRVALEDGVYYVLYGGSSYLADEPDYFGLARSTDGVHFEKHPGNPIFGCSAKGEADGGAIWFPALFEQQDRFCMLYEGSRGKYSFDCSSEICLSWIQK